MSVARKKPLPKPLGQLSSFHDLTKTFSALQEDAAFLASRFTDAMISHLKCITNILLSRIRYYYIRDAFKRESTIA